MLREAIRLLEAYGVVHSRRGFGGGLIVGRPEPIYTVAIARSYLDHLHLPLHLLVEAWEAGASAAAGLAAEKASTRQREELLRLVGTPSASDSPDSLTEFHHLVARMSGNRVYTLLGGIMTGVVASRLRITVNDRKLIHQDMAATAHAVIERSSSFARRHMISHLRRIANYGDDRLPV